jgi:hypothetical protein
MYILTRENDDKKLQGEVARFIEWSDEGRFSKIHDEPAEGRSLILDPQYFSYTWMTTEITSFAYEDNILKFSTKNSNYILEILS